MSPEHLGLMWISFHFPTLCFDSLQGSCGMGRDEVWKGEARLLERLFTEESLAGASQARESLLLLGSAQ